MLSFATSVASAMLNAMAAPLVAEQAVMPGPQRRPAIDDMFMMDPLPDIRRCGAAHLAPKKRPRALTANSSSQRPASKSLTKPECCTPEFCTRTSRPGQSRRDEIELGRTRIEAAGRRRQFDRVDDRPRGLIERRRA